MLYEDGVSLPVVRSSLFQFGVVSVGKNVKAETNSVQNVDYYEGHSLEII